MSTTSNDRDCPSDSQLIETYFIEGSLGVTLKRRPNDGPIYVYNLIENAQAIDKDIQINDEVWSVGSHFIGQNPVTKEEWEKLIEIMQKSKRPLRIVWRRKIMSTTTATVFNKELQNSHQRDNDNIERHDDKDDRTIQKDPQRHQLKELITR